MTDRSSRRPDELALALYGAGGRTSRRERWRRWARTGLPISAAIVVVIAVAVIVDQPSPVSRASERSAGVALLNQVNGDVTPCAFALGEAATLYRGEVAGSLRPGQRSQVPTLLQDDADACSFTSANINDLTSIEEPGTGIGRYLAEVVALSVTWTTSDALGAIDDVIALSSHRADRHAARDLALRQRYLGGDRRAARTALAAADRFVGGGLPALGLPAVSLTS